MNRKIFAAITVAAFFTAGYTASAQNNSGYYDNTGYYDTGYGDGMQDDYYNQDPLYPQQQGMPVNQPVGFNDFYNQLTPYGAWINIPPYGMVWVPNVRHFQPYSTNGYWAFTNYGWTWVSNYQWGWAPFHYGRWGYTSRYGWYWVPGYNWGPAWVAWSSGSDMFGWAPLMPGMSFNVTLSVNLFPSRYWTFLPGRYMGYPNMGNYYVSRSRNTTIIRNVTIINNFGTENNRRFSMGPSVNDVQKRTGRTIQPMRVSNASSISNMGVSNNELRVYRPVSRDSGTSGRTTTSTAGNNGSRTTTPQSRPGNQSDQTGARTQPQGARTQPQERPQTQDARTQPQGARTQPQNTGTQPAGARTQPQERSRPEQSMETTPSRTYTPNPSQPPVTQRSAPQKTRQIQNAARDTQRAPQQSSAPTSTSRGR